MKNLVLKMPFQNESSEPVKIYLEPLSEYFFIQPGDKVEVHAIFDEQTSNLNFTVASNDGFLTIYAPGEITGFVDCYMTLNGIRLVPDGN
jgi:hypothetical protein